MSSEREENDKYKKTILSILKNNENDFCTFRKEKQLDFIFASLDRIVGNRQSLSFLDLCCGYGRLIHFLQLWNNKQNYLGVDYLDELTSRGKSIFKDFDNISFETSNAYEISKKYTKQFDVSIIHKTLSWLPYYENVVKELIAVTKESIIITSLFWEGDIDFIVKCNENASISDNFSYLNTYSFPKFEKFCMKNGARKVYCTPMKLNFDLEKTANLNELSTYTLKQTDNSRLEINGPIIQNWMLVQIDL